MEETPEQSSNNLAYIVGAVALVLVLGAAFFLRPKMASTTVSPQGGTSIAVTPTPGPITGLACDTQYYNPKNFTNEYYLSVEGGDVIGAKTVSCAFSMTVDGKAVGTANATSPLSAAPERGGATFKCTTEAIALEPNVETTVDVVLTDNLQNSATCAATFTFPPGI